jgi:glutathione S-transferase
VDFANWIGLPLEADFENLAAWHERVSSRPTARA